MFPESIFADIESGNAVLVTGAGASLQGRTSSGAPIPTSGQLAEQTAKAANFNYAGEPLADVFDAAKVPLGTTKLRQIFERSFLNCSPSPTLSSLFGVTWRRVYTFNIDDTIEHIPHASRRQQLVSFNAMKDRRAEWNGFNECQVVHLHGFIRDFSDGFIFSNDDYAGASSSSSAWYQQLGEDFVNYTVIFVGTSLQEQLLFQNIRSALAQGGTAGISFSITPGSLSEIKQKSLEARGISHIPATIETFAAELSKRFPRGLSPRDLKGASAASALPAEQKFTSLDVEALRSLHPITRQVLDKRFPGSTANIAAYRRRFYEGYGPNWPVMRDGSYARLRQYHFLIEKAKDALQSNRAVILLGEAGSGKSTFCMHCALHLSEVSKLQVLEYQEGTTSFRQCMISLKKYLGDDVRAVILIDEFHIFHEDIWEVVSDSTFSNISFLTSARSGEWHDRLKRQARGDHSTLAFQRFDESDIPEIIGAIEKYFAAPTFNRLSLTERHARFHKSRKQLLIAMREATESKGFDEIIEDEFSRIESLAQRYLLFIVAVATIPRVGLERSTIVSILHQLGVAEVFGDLVASLEGIVDQSKDGRFQARHQLYASEIVYKNARFSEIEATISGMVSYFAAFKMPIIKHVSKMEGQLFKYLLNNKNIFDLYNDVRKRNDAATFYSQFELTLQLDGHYWLQYGLLLRRLGQHEESLKKLEKALEAFPDFTYAEHAIAQQKLILAVHRPRYDTRTANMVSEAVSALLERHYAMDVTRADHAIDEYPIVALGHYHIDALVRHGMLDEARRTAKRYFEEVSRIDSASADKILGQMRSKLLMLSTTGVWPRLHYRVGAIDFS